LSLEVHPVVTEKHASSACAGPAAPYVRCRGISKSYGHVQALKNLDVDVFEGEILAIVGDNGAGKSTLVKILSGVTRPDRGSIQIGTEEVRISTARRGRELGIATVFQTLALVNCRDVACNLSLGREPTFWRIFVNRTEMLARARNALAELNVHIPSLHAEVGELSGGQRQCVAIARATSQNARVLIMDEPTAALGVRESGKVLDVIARLKSSGRGVVLITHNMHHVFSVADRILVLRRGEVAGVRRKPETSPDEVVSLIVGGQGLHSYEPGKAETDAVTENPRP
jgi:ABC-type sugar transport system ATPase subunit